MWAAEPSRSGSDPLLRELLVQVEAHRAGWEAAGSAISLPAERFRTPGVEMTGAGTRWPEVVHAAFHSPWAWARTGELETDLEEVPRRWIADA